MPDLQELIRRGRMLLASAPSRFEVFHLIDGKSTAREISRKTARPLPAVINDIDKLKNADLIRPRTDKKGLVIKRNRSVIFEKTPLVKTVPKSYFSAVAKVIKTEQHRAARPSTKGALPKLSVPTAAEILEICNRGEDQFYEFKACPIDISKITKEIAGFLHTRRGGIIFYGIEDDGAVQGSDLRRQEFDSRLHNSIRNTINPQPDIEVRSVDVMGCAIILVVIPPWDRKRKNLYQFGEKYYIRKGTNVFALRPEEIRQLSEGKYIV